MPRTRRPEPPKRVVRPARRAYLLTNRADPDLRAALLQAHRLDPAGPLTPDVRRRFAEVRARSRRTGEPIHLILNEG